MNNEIPESPDALHAYLKPQSSTWEPLSEDTFFHFLKAREKRDLTEEEKRGIANNKQYINEVLSSSLQLPNLSLFAGSGTSLGEVKGPSMWDLWCKSVLLSPEAIDGDKNYKKLSDIAKTVLGKVKYEERENPNIEHLLSQCDAYLIFNEDAEVEAFLHHIKEIIIEQCSSFIDKADCDLSAYKNLLQKLARRRVRDPRLKIFTTNYDMCFETAASQLGMMIIDGFSYTRRRRFDGHFFDYDVVNRERDSHEFVDGVVKLFKLHGSVSWQRENNEIIERDKPEPKTAALIYPAKGKYQQAFIQPHLELLSRFIEALRQPNSCLLISGFGFNDDHLSEPILSAIKSNPSLKLIIADNRAATHLSTKMNPYWNELSLLSGQGYDIHFFNGTFSYFVSLIPNLRALTPAEQLAKAVKRVN
jgi:SIR2-like protein